MIVIVHSWDDDDMRRFRNDAVIVIYHYRRRETDMSLNIGVQFSSFLTAERIAVRSKLQCNPLVLI